MTNFSSFAVSVTEMVSSSTSVAVSVTTSVKVSVSDTWVYVWKEKIKIVREDYRYIKYSDRARELN